MKIRIARIGFRRWSSRMSLGAVAVFLCGGVSRAEPTPMFIVPVGNSPKDIFAITNAITTPAKAPEPPTLDERRLYALGMIETGNNDWEIGAAGEISRYQINPVIWKTYSPRADYRDPVAAIRVARQHWAWLAGYFAEKAGRQPTDFDMYVLWNTKFGYYARRGFSPLRLAATVRDRAQRFVNLVNRPQ